MTADLINLRRARKARARIEQATTAAESRASHGRTKADRVRSAAETELAERRLDGSKREPPGHGDTGPDDTPRDGST